MYLNAAVDDFETFTGKALFTTTYTLYLEDFPTGMEIVLPRSPATAVASVKYYDDTGTLQTYAASNYNVTINDPDRPAIWVADTADWPSVQADNPEAVEIAFTAGYGALITDVPPMILNGIILYAGHLYDHRTASAAEELEPVRERIFGRLKARFY